MRIGVWWKGRKGGTQNNKDNQLCCMRLIFVSSTEILGMHLDCLYLGEELIHSALLIVLITLIVFYAAAFPVLIGNYS